VRVAREVDGWRGGEEDLLFVLTGGVAERASRRETAKDATTARVEGALGGYCLPAKKSGHAYGLCLGERAGAWVHTGNESGREMRAARSWDLRPSCRRARTAARERGGAAAL
jgi:hypothetical protein